MTTITDTKRTPAPPAIETDEEVREKLAPLYRVICHDDPVTTMDFVIQVLRGVFRQPEARAVELMLRVHQTGAAVIACYPRETAKQRVQRATTLARADGFPLTFTVELDD